MAIGNKRIYASRKLRKGRVSIPGGCYLVTFATRGRVRLFDDAGHAVAFARASTDCRLWRDARLLAWVLMPDHWHGLIELGDDANLSRVVQRLKTNTARSIEVSAPVWQGGFHDRAIREGRRLRAAARYLVANPLRAGLVDSVGLWPWWDAVWL